MRRADSYYIISTRAGIYRTLKKISELNDLNASCTLLFFASGKNLHLTRCCSHRPGYGPPTLVVDVTDTYATDDLKPNARAQTSIRICNSHLLFPIKHHHHIHFYSIYNLYIKSTLQTSHPTHHSSTIHNALLHYRHHRPLRCLHDRGHAGLHQACNPLSRHRKYPPMLRR